MATHPSKRELALQLPLSTSFLCIKKRAKNNLQKTWVLRGGSLTINIRQGYEDLFAMQLSFYIPQTNYEQKTFLKIISCSNPLL